MRAHIGGFVFHILLLLVIFLSMIDNIFLFRGKIFWLEIIITGGLIVIASVSAGRYAQRGASRAMLLFYVIALLNITVLSFIVGEIFWPPLLLAAAGTLISMKNRRKIQTDRLGNVHVEEVKPEPMSPEMLAGVSEPIVESRVIKNRPVKRKKKKKAGKKR